MKAVVLLSAGIHPRSGAAMPVPVELQAIALARRLGCDVVGIHAGQGGPAVEDCLAHGLDQIILLRIREGNDPLAAITAEIAAQKPDLILAGRRGQGGADSGMLPYLLAKACEMPIAADAVALAVAPEGLAVVQALPRGARRRLVVRLPAVVTVHESAAPALPFVYRDRLCGKIIETSGIAAPAPAFACETRPYRRRPKLIGDAGGSAEERLWAATEQKSAGGKLMVNPEPAEAAAAILDFMRRFQ
jgi:electron transfer flavoprotein beta subunit